jgi:hypothetical protein
VRVVTPGHDHLDPPRFFRDDKSHSALERLCDGPDPVAARGEGEDATVGRETGDGADRGEETRPAISEAAGATADDRCAVWRG